jgi:alpha-D-xyloside xylohydrolase
MTTGPHLPTYRRLQCCLTAAVALAGLPAIAAVNPIPEPVLSWQKQTDGVTFQLPKGFLKLQVWTPRTVRVQFIPTGSVSSPPSLSVIASPQPVPWRMTVTPAFVSVSTGPLQVRVDRNTSAIRFLDAQGRPVLRETPGARSLTPTGPSDRFGYRASQSFELPADEDIYGLGQHRLPTSQGNMSYRGTTVTLEQANREVAIPFLTSSRGYGLLWDCPAHTEVSVGAGVSQTIPSAQLFTEDGTPGGLTARYYNGHDLSTLVTTRTDKQVDFNWPDAPAPGLGHDYFSVRWTGSVQAQEQGDYTFVTTSDDGVRLWVDDKPLIEDWSNHAARDDSATVHFAAHSRHKIRMEFFQDTRDAIARLAWRHGIPQTTVWTSEAARGIDYYLMLGPALDRVMAEVRHLTGQAPLPPKWALGYWQSKERYGSQQEWLDVASRYRESQEPIDNIVQDFLYWEPFPWGSNAFDPKRYPDPAAAIARLHEDYHIHLMISVWGKFYPSSPDNPDANYDELNKRGFLYPPEPDGARYYDAFNPAARAAYWGLLRDQLYSKGVDAWWLDASEPEVDMRTFRNVQTALGPASFLLNAWPLMHTTGVYEGQRATAPNKRVFILTRSAYAGQQRNAAATWSGDITGDWDTFGRQIPAGLDFCLSGIPYWTTDIGGFFVNYPGGSENPEYRELFTRWFQWGAFCPIFRVHGTNTPKELWRFGPEYEPILVQYDRLRYRLLPYIYSQAWRVTAHAGTIMRALVMDFPADVEARECRDEFLFGPALLVCPVTKKGATSRPVYLPSGASWIDFWTGRTYKGGQTIQAPAPIQTMPIYVRAGSILPMGPVLQYADEKPADPIELRIYRGQSGTFTLYEDDGETTDYEKGQCATIPVAWNEPTGTLTIGERKGTFPGMLRSRKFRIVWVRKDRGTGLESSQTPDEIVSYTGKSVTVRPKGEIKNEP